MPPTTRRTFVTALAGSPLLAAGAFSLSAQEKLNLCCTTGPQALPPVYAHIHGEFVRAYHESQADVWNVGPLRSAESAVRLWVAHAREQKTDQVLAKALRERNQDEVVSGYFNDVRKERLTAKIRESIPGYVLPLDTQPPSYGTGVRGYNALAKGEYTKYLSGTHKYLLLMIKQQEKVAAARGPLVRIANLERRCIPDWCDELAQERDVAESMLWVICVLGVAIPGTWIECVALGAYWAFMNYRFSQNCQIRMSDPESCW